MGMIKYDKYAHYLQNIIGVKFVNTLKHALHVSCARGSCYNNLQASQRLEALQLHCICFYFFNARRGNRRNLINMTKRQVLKISTTCEAIAWSPWKVDPKRNQSFILRVGAAVERF